MNHGRLRWFSFIPIRHSLLYLLLNKMFFQYFRYLKLRCFSRRCVRDGPLPPQPCAGRLLRELPVLSHKRGGPKGALCLSNNTFTMSNVFLFCNTTSVLHIIPSVLAKRGRDGVWHGFLLKSSHRRLVSFLSSLITLFYRRLVWPRGSSSCVTRSHPSRTASCSSTTSAMSPSQVRAVYLSTFQILSTQT